MMHGHGRMGAAPASDAAACVSVPRLSFFFFLGFAPTWLQFGLIPAEPGQFGQNRVVSAELDRIGRRPKQAEIGLESRRNS